MSKDSDTFLSKLKRIADIFEPPSRIIVALLALVVAFYLALHPSIYAWLFFGISLFLFWDYFRHSSVWIAFREFRKGNLEQVRRLLDQVKWPNMLDLETRAYYHWLRGVVEVADNRMAAAKVQLLVAASGRLKTENDRSLVQCLLAEVALQCDDKPAAAEHLRLAANLDHHTNVNAIIRTLSARL